MARLLCPLARRASPYLVRALGGLADGVPRRTSVTGSRLVDWLHARRSALSDSGY